MTRTILLLALFAPAISHTLAAEYACPVERKLIGPSDGEYTPAQLAKSQFSVLIEDFQDQQYILRCSYAQSAGKVTCDRYKADRVEFDPHPKIKKYYYFRGQFDVQVFSDLSFIENNGRGSVAFGRCTLTAP